MGRLDKNKPGRKSLR